MANSVNKLPSTFGERLLPFTPTLRQRQRGKGFSTDGYVHDVKMTGDSSIMISAKCFRSQHKSQTPHTLNMELKDDKISSCGCSCKAGYVYLLQMVACFCSCMMVM